MSNFSLIHGYPRSPEFDGVSVGGAVASENITLTKILLRRPSLLADQDWQGMAVIGTAGETITKGNLLYKKYTGSPTASWKWFKYSANGTDKLILPDGIALADIASGADGAILVMGVYRNDAWNLTATVDTAVTIYAGETAGNLTLTAPTTLGDEIIVVGTLVANNTILVRPGYGWGEN